MLSDNKIRSILNKYRNDFDELELYDRTREISWGRERMDVTLDKKIIKKLKMLRDKTGRPVSRIIEEAVGKIK